MSGKLRWGIIGTGAIAKTLANGLKHAETGELVAVGSRSQESADAFGKEFGLDRCHASYDALLADEQVDVVYVSTPHPFHAEWAIAAANAGKHVLCEKPFTVNHGEAMYVLEAARRNGVFLMEAFMYRCHPQTAKIVELVKSGAIGAVRMIRASFGFQAGFNAESRLFKNELAGGGIMDVGCYPVSFSRLIAGAALGRDFANPVDVKGAGHLGETGVDHWATGILKFENDIVAQVATAVQQNLDNSATIFGEGGRIDVPNPWTADRKGGGAFKIIVHKRGSEPETIEISTDVAAFTMEADVVGRAIAAGKTQADAPAMQWQDTLGNIKTLDQWRGAIGLIYENEKPEKYLHTVSRRPLKKRDDAPMKYGKIEGVDKPISRLVMGVDNQREMTHTAAMFDDFFERGGNAWDSAWQYGGGMCERMLGQWVKNRGVREQVVILDKGAHTPNCYPEALTKQFMESLERLQMDYMDIYMMHRDNLEVPVGEFIDAMNEQVEAGRARIFGCSNWTLERIEAANAYAKEHGKQGFSAVSNNFSLARMIEPVWKDCIAASEPEYKAWHEETQMPLMPWSSQARGFFTDRAGPDKREDESLVRCWYSDENFKRRDRAFELARKYDVEPIAIALAYVLCQPFPTFPLIGPRLIEETRTSMPGLGVELTPDEVKWLNLEA